MPFMDWRRHLVTDPAICHGRPTVRGTRVLVSVLLSHLAHGETAEEILGQFPTVSPEALRAVVAFAAESAFDDLPAPLPAAASGR